LALVLRLQFADLRGQSLAGDSGPDLGHPDGDEDGADEEGEHDDGQGGTVGPGKRVEERGERRDHLVGGFDEQADGQEFVEVHGVWVLGAGRSKRGVNAAKRPSTLPTRCRCPARAGAGYGSSPGSSLPESVERQGPAEDRVLPKTAPPWK